MQAIACRKHFIKAFTLVELLVVIAILTLLSCLLVPALARARIKSPAAGCLSNLRQLMVGWSMYKEDNNDILMPNPDGTYPASEQWTPNGESWSATDGNTNVATMLSGTAGSYAQANSSIFRCPGDVVPSANGFRIRSYSMNSQMGSFYPGVNYNQGWKQYARGSDLTCPTPANAFILCDEHPCPDDGFLQVSLSSAAFPDPPAGWHQAGGLGACGFSYADGHADIHPWVTTALTSPVIVGNTPNYPPIPFGSKNADWIYTGQR
jgi:prepilin-type N-terminal cleavage/methylation domain-containing protein